MREHFVLPPGKVQISFSGGRTSAFMLYQILEANGGIPEERCEVIFCNTGREMPQTLDFVAEAGRRWGVAITWLEWRPAKPLFEVVGYQGASRNGEPFEALIEKRRYLPNQAQRFCTEELKVLTAKRYLRSLGWDRWTNCIGIRADEAHRAGGGQAGPLGALASAGGGRRYQAGRFGILAAAAVRSAVAERQRQLLARQLRRLLPEKRGIAGGAHPGLPGSGGLVGADGGQDPADQGPSADVLQAVQPARAARVHRAAGGLAVLDGGRSLPGQRWRMRHLMEARLVRGRPDTLEC